MNKITALCALLCIVFTTTNSIKAEFHYNLNTLVQPEPKYNYVGTVGGIKIKANIIYKEAYHVPNSGAIRIPIGGYYFYETTKVKIPIKGECNGLGIIYFSASTIGGMENFDGKFINSQLSDMEGTWTKGNKSLYFKLKSLE